MMFQSSSSNPEFLPSRSMMLVDRDKSFNQKFRYTHCWHSWTISLWSCNLSNFFFLRLRCIYFLCKFTAVYVRIILSCRVITLEYDLIINKSIYIFSHFEGILHMALTFLWPYYIKQVDSMLSFVCSVKDHRWHQWHTRLTRLVYQFFVLTGRHSHEMITITHGAKE